MKQPTGSRRIVLPLERAGTSRRTFLKRTGYGVAAATLAACSRAPVVDVVPRLVADETARPGGEYRIATTCGGCAAACGVLAKCTSGRPVKVEGLPGHPVSAGGLCAVGQAQILGLYDSHRLAAPTVGATRGTWETLDGLVVSKLDGAKGRVRILTGTISGPSTRAAIDAVCRRFGARHVAYDVLSASGIADAHGATHGVRAVPHYRFDAARVIASFGADFLGTWISPVEFAAGWAAGRRLAAAAPTISKHWQIEARTSMTGLRADRRVTLAPWETAAALAELRDAVRALAAGGPASGARPFVADLAADLHAARGESLVVADDADPAAQTLVNELNVLLGNYGRTVDIISPSRARLGDDNALRELLAEMRAGDVGALVVAGCNPVYDLSAAGFADALAKVPFVVAVAGLPDETTAAAHAVAPQLHALESWDDAEPVAGVYCLTQPAITALRPARSLRCSLARWTGSDRSEADLLRDHWRTSGVLPSGAAFDRAFDKALHDGFILSPKAAGSPPAARGLPAPQPTPRQAPAAGTFAVVLYPKVAILDGSQAQNAWLQELPDPVSKTTWDNYACLSPATAAALGVATGDVVRIDADGASAIEIPALVQTGQHDGIVALAIGYGRSGTDRFAEIGPQWLESKPTVERGRLVGTDAGRLAGRSVRLTPTGAKHPLACTQDHHSLTVPAHLAPKHGKVRDAVRTLPFAAFVKDPAHAVERHTPPNPGLWPDDHPKTGHRWGMVIDLAACNGCSACVVACQAENNIPAVGRDEVLRHREMQWLRIDRYYEEREGGVSASQQPMTCQHCANAPCETVCPVLATVHSSEGLNQQVYNRCVGTRYCANNCPYKVRRFNWFDYPRPDATANLVLNPVVTVRSRGVMEKCSLCVQRIQAAKAESARTGKPLSDGDVRTACQDSCPAGAIVFGDLNDPGSAVSRRAAEGRSYEVLAELNVRPAVSYLADVRNRPGDATSAGEANHGE